MKQILPFLLITIGVACAARGGLITVRANEKGLWQDHSLVYAVIDTVTSVGSGEYRVTIRPIATLTGKFDCGLSAEIVLTFLVGLGTPVPMPPEPDTRALVLITEKETVAADGKRQRECFLSPSRVSFMPGGSSIAKVSGIEDRPVTEIMEKVRKGRMNVGQDSGK